MRLSELIFGYGGMKKSELAQMTYRKKFSDYLPWVAYDPDMKAYLNLDNTIGFMWECFPQCFAGEKTIKVLEGLLRINLPEGSIMQFILHADPYIDPYVEAYKELKTRDDSLVESVTNAFCDFLSESRNGVKNVAGILMRNYRLFVTIKVPQTKKNDVDIKDVYEVATELLRGAGLYPLDFSPNELLDWSRRFLNDTPSSNNGHYNEDIPIRKQVIFSETEISKDNRKINIGKKVFRCTTPRSFPKEVNVIQVNQLFGGIYGIISDMDQIKTPFLYTLNIIFQNLKPFIHAKCNLVLQQQAVGSFAPSLMRKKDEYLWATDEVEKGTVFFRVIPTFWVYAENEEDTSANESITRVKRIWESQGFIMQEDRGILPILFISSLPFGLYNMDSNIDNLDRDFIAPIDTVATILSVQSDFSGGGRPVITFMGRKGQVIGIDIFDKGVNNHNIFVSAASGTGKSFFVNYLAFNYYASNAMVRIIDIGGSYKKMTKMFGAKYLDFNEKANICLNPFTSITEPEHDLPAISPVIAQMVYSSENRFPTETEMTVIKNAIKWAYETEGTDAGIDTVYQYLNTFPKHAANFDFDCPDKQDCAADIKTLAHTLAFNIYEFTSDGMFGKFFKGRSNFDISKDEFVVLELEHLKPQKELFKVITMQVINAVTMDLYLSDRTRPKFIIFDEAWQFLGEGVHMKSVIEEGYRRARKYNGSFTIITQSILDLKQFGNVGDVIRGNSEFKFYLESADFEKARREKLIDYGDFEMDILKSVKSNKPKYSEIFMDTPFGVGVARLVVDPYSYYIYTSDAREIAEIESMVDGGMNYEEAAKEMVRKYRS